MDNVWNQGFRSLEKSWRILALLGAASIFIGSLAIAAAFVATLATVVFIGGLVLAGAMIHFIESLHTRGWGGFFGHALVAVLYTVAGWYMIMHPAVSAASLTLLIGMLLAVGGIYQVVTSIATRYKSWGWALLQGVISILLGVLIFAQWPISALWVIGVFIGIDLLFRGWATLMLAMAVRTAVEAPGLKNRPQERRQFHLSDRRVAA